LTASILGSHAPGAAGGVGAASRGASAATGAELAVSGGGGGGRLGVGRGRRVGERESLVLAEGLEFGGGEAELGVGD
jgi:hypothetical protein